MIKVVYLEIFLSYLRVWEVLKKYESLWKNYILEKSSFVVCLELDTPVWNFASLGDWMLSIILRSIILRFDLRWDRKEERDGSCL